MPNESNFNSLDRFLNIICGYHFFGFCLKLVEDAPVSYKKDTSGISDLKGREYKRIRKNIKPHITLKMS